MHTTISALNSQFVPQSSTFATHVNLLKTLGPGIKTVLELGAGEFSTRLFLDRSFYPDLTELHTVEQDRNWVICQEDPRHKISIVPEPIEPFLNTLNFDDYDLIFADNSMLRERRCDTLRYVASHTNRSLVVSHDFEIDMYREAAKGFDHTIIDDRQIPWTTLLWNTR